MAKPHKTIPFNPAAHLAKSLKNPAFKAAYDALEDEFSALDTLLLARKEAGLTQAEVAERMGIAQSSLARIESSLGSRKYSPSLATLRRYAEACERNWLYRLVNVTRVAKRYPSPSLGEGRREGNGHGGFVIRVGNVDHAR